MAATKLIRTSHGHQVDVGEHFTTTRWSRSVKFNPRPTKPKPVALKTKNTSNIIKYLKEILSKGKFLKY